MGNNIVPFDAALAEQFYYSDEEFPISFNMAWQWLGYTRKADARRALMNSGARKDVDYCADMRNKPSSNASGFITVERLTLTVNCFMHLAMMARTDKGKEVREYFLQCEKRLKDLIRGLRDGSDISLLPREYKLAILAFQNDRLRKRTKKQQALLNPDQNQA